MPKVLDDVKDRVLAEARAVLTEKGYKALTMRSVAEKCGVSVGTVYNYYRSKEFLTGCVVLADWLETFGAMTKAAGSASTAGEGLRQIYALMLSFCVSHAYLAASGVAPGNGQYSYREQHGMLLEQVRSAISSLLRRTDVEAPGDLETFLAESVINCGVKLYPYELVAGAFARLLGQDYNGRNVK